MILSLQDRRHREMVHRRAIAASLSREGREIQRSQLAAAAANTSDAVPLAPIGVLLWPGREHLNWIEQDLGLSHRRFLVVRSDRVPDWSRIYSGRTLPVFDPHGLSLARDVFGAKVRAIGLPVIHAGVDACRAALTVALPCEGVTS